MIDFTLQKLELSNVIASSTQTSERIPFKEPLSLADQKFIEWLAERYEGKCGTPVMTFACDGITNLIVPVPLVMKRLRNESFSVETKSVLQFPATGAE